MKLTLMVLFVGLALGQTPAGDNVRGTLAFRHIETELEVQTIAKIVQQTAAIRDLSVDTAAGTVTLSGTSDQMALAEWLFHELDWPPMPSPAPATHEFGMPVRVPGGSDEVVKVFYLAHADQQTITDITMALRPVADIPRLFSYDTRRILVARGTADRIVVAEWIIHELDQLPSQIKPGAAHDYPSPLRLPGRSGDLVKVFYLAHADNIQVLINMVQAIRTIAGVSRVYPIYLPRAVVLCASADQMARAERVVRDRDQPGK